MAYTEIDDPSAYFQIKLYTAAGSYTFDGNSDMQPDWMWIKERNGTNEHNLFDSVRGTTKRLESSTTAAEQTSSTTLTAFGSDGFTVGNNPGTGQNGGNYVGWGWKAGTSFTNNAGANGANLATTAGSVNTDAGFSILKWNSSGMAGEGLLAHGLGVVPSVIIIKATSTTDDWYTYHKSLGATKYVRLNQTAAETSSSWLENKTPTSTLISLDNGFWGTSSIDYICYAFSEKQGYSKFGSYTGNGNADGTFVYTGFKPAFVLCKNTGNAGAQWLMVDNKRVGINPIENYLQSNSNSAEGTGTDNFDFLSNGFKCRSTNSWSNQSGYNIIYMAFASNPFTTSTGVPATAK